jgi:hypothetical protein
MLIEEAKYWWKNARHRLEAAGTKITYQRKPSESPNDGGLPQYFFTH